MVDISQAILTINIPRHTAHLLLLLLFLLLQTSILTFPPLLHSTTDLPSPYIRGRSPTQGRFSHMPGPAGQTTAWNKEYRLLRGTGCSQRVSVSRDPHRLIRERDRERARDSFPVRVVRWETGALAGVAASVISYLTWHNAVCVWVCLVICPFWHGSKRPAGGHEITKRRAAFINLIQHIRRLMGEGEGFAALLTYCTSVYTVTVLYSTVQSIRTNEVLYSVHTLSLNGFIINKNQSRN